MKKLLIIILFLYCCYLSKFVEIPNNSLRIRVIGSSNSKEDIHDKKIVYNALVYKINSIIKDSKNIDKSNKLIIDNKKEINDYINKTFKIYNIKNNYIIKYGYNYFPEKKYLSKKYKSGGYNSIIIKIGNAKGNNCWCAIYPNACLVNKNSLKNHKVIIKSIIW